MLRASLCSSGFFVYYPFEGMCAAVNLGITIRAELPVLGLAGQPCAGMVVTGWLDDAVGIEVSNFCLAACIFIVAVTDAAGVVGKLACCGARGVNLLCGGHRVRVRGAAEV